MSIYKTDSVELLKQKQPPKTKEAKKRPLDYRNDIKKYEDKRGVGMERKTLREVIRDIEEYEVWEDIENKDSILKIFLENNEIVIESRAKLSKLVISIDEAIFKKVSK